MQNSGIGQSVEGIVESYGLPNKKEIDPSKIVSWFYVFLFGLMLSDAAYGLIMFIACAVLLKKYKKMELSMRKSIKLFMYCGISTLMWGILFGGYFGDAVETVSKTFFGHAVMVKPLWFAPLSDPMKFAAILYVIWDNPSFCGIGSKGIYVHKGSGIFEFLLRCSAVVFTAGRFDNAVVTDGAVLFTIIS